MEGRNDGGGKKIRKAWLCQIGATSLAESDFVSTCDKHRKTTHPCEAALYDLPTWLLDEVTAENHRLGI